MRRNAFDDIAYKYDEALPIHISKHYLEKRVCFLKRYLKPGCKVLDVGCGTGRLITHLLSADELRAYACDSSFEMLKIASKCTDIRTACCLSDRLPYAQNTFDIVISIAVMHHLISEAAVLKTISEMIRVVKEGGKVVIWDANSLNPYWKLLFKKIPHDRDVKGIIPLSKMINKAKKLNISGVEVLKSGWVPDFAPKKIFLFFKLFEYIMERTPLIRFFSSHNIMVFTK